MEAIILAAGMGTRISSYWKKPKCLMEVGGTSIIKRQLKALLDAGVSQVHIVVGCQKELVFEHLMYLDNAPKINFIDNASFSDKGNTYSLYLGLKAATEDVLLLDGDLYFESSILEPYMQSSSVNSFVVGEGTLDDIECAKTLINKKNKCIAALIDKRRVTPIELEQYEFVGEAIGIIMMRKGSLQQLLETCEKFLSDEKNILKNWEHYFNSCLNAIDFEYVFTHSNQWIEIDNKSDLVDAQNLFFSK